MAEAEKRRKTLSVEARTRKRESDRERGKTRVNVGLAFNRWRDLKEKKGYKTDAELAFFLLDKSCDSDVWDDHQVPQVVSGSSVQQCNGETSAEIQIVLKESMRDQPSGAPQSSRNDFSRSSFTPDEEENSDLTESSYVDVNREVLVLLMFRCLDCSGECHIQGKGKGGNLSLKQECVNCRHCRLWTSQPAFVTKDKVADMHLARVCGSNSLNSDQDYHKRSLLMPTHQNKNPVQEEVDANDNDLIVKREAEDVEKVTESLVMEMYEDNDPDTLVKYEDSVEEDDFNVENVSARDGTPSQTSLAGQVEGVPDEHGTSDLSTEESEEESEEDSSEDDSEEGWHKSMGEERPDADWTNKKIIQNTIKPIIWCIDCGAVAHMFCILRRHQRIYGCAECGMGESVENAESSSFKDFSVYFTDIQSFHKHAIVMHGATENLPERMICPDCNKTIRVQTDPNKKGHVCEYKSKPFCCPVCRKRFATEIGQKVHYRRLHGEYTHTCKYCMIEFDSKVSKLKHEHTHSKEKLAYICPECPEKFKDFIARNQHLKSHGGQKQYICSTCGRPFYSLSVYERHMLTHSGEKPFKCEVCERSFNQAGHLKSHMRLHTGERPFMCEQCGECFNHNVSLKNHVQRYHGDSTPLSVKENKQKGTGNKTKHKKRRRTNSKLDMKMEGTDTSADLDSSTESQDSSSEETEARKKRGSKDRARRRKWKKTQLHTASESWGCGFNPSLG
ncbi:zinc finger protein 619-like isoform X2 [Hoplias malabaricus]|uniref:zinc finger protein 619-like isoform X2 n=1 Tax=Hoplias malabaricus TaxID=27720 RepID=UPI003462DAAC